ncbi:hypothetical protein C0J52_22428 [Blattella germanica]|nr:hypothetical protein C0J52_22428 [Blattella germanica]
MSRDCPYSDWLRAPNRLPGTVLKISHQENGNQDYRLHAPNHDDIHINSFSDDSGISSIMANLNVSDGIQVNLDENRMLLCTTCIGRAEATSRCQECALNLCYSCLHDHRTGAGQNHTIIRISAPNSHSPIVGSRGPARNNVLNNIEAVGNPLLNAITNIASGSTVQNNVSTVASHLINAVSVNSAISNSIYCNSSIPNLDLPSEGAASAMVPNIPNNPTSNGIKYPSRIMCPNHKNKDGTFYCQTCKLPACESCGLLQHKNHNVKLTVEYVNVCKRDIRKLQTDISDGKYAMDRNKKKSMDSITKLIEIKDKCMSEITEVTNEAISLIKDKGTSLMIDCEKLYQAKTDGLQNHSKELQQHINKLSEFDKMLNNALESSNPAEIIRLAEYVGNEVTSMKRISLEPPEDTVMTFCSKQEELNSAIQNFGSVHGSVSSKESYLAGPRLYTGLREKHNRIMVQLRDHLDQPVIAENEQNNLIVSIFSSSGCQTALTVEKIPLKSAARVTYYPKGVGLLTMHFKIRGKEIKGSPVTINVFEPRDYRRGFHQPILIIGKEGGKEGEFCRPWGVCCNNRGNIFVADRSNNRIQVFLKNGDFSYSFGTYGAEPGKFDRPTGIAWDSYYDRLVICDKDNHRIQIFSVTGRLISCFGEKGLLHGQFLYPWDVAVNSEGEIVVSDTRNRRIQLFSPEGRFIMKFGSETIIAMWKVFDAPRGVCFDQQDTLIFTDFNIHRVGLIFTNHDNKWISKVGERNHYFGPEYRFLRPQGIQADDDGNILVADSKNNRILVFKQDGALVYIFGTPGNDPGQFDRPSGMCLHPEGGIVVVDFGNSRVQVF